MRIRFRLFEYSASVRRWLLLLIYSVQLCASLWLAYELRFDFMVNATSQEERLFVLLWMVPLQLVFLALFHQLNPLLGYFSTPDLARMFHALGLSTIVSGGVWFTGGEGVAPPRGVLVMNFIFALVGLTGVRLLLRASREMMATTKALKGARARGVGIIGAGDAGATLAHELQLKPGFGLRPVAFFDDDDRKWKSRVHDLPVLGSPVNVLEVRDKLQIEQAIIAMPNAPASRVGEIVRFLGEAHVECRTIPSVDQLALGQVKVSQLRSVDVQDLLGRDRVELDTEEIRQALEGRVILITGAGGSIGSELCRQIAACQPARLLLLDRAEPQVFLIEQELLGLGHVRDILPIVGDVLDRERMAQVLREQRPQMVFHAAAHKHVPMMEFQPGEAIQNNSLGTAQLAELALEFGVERFVLISSDKAINPTNVMGATKRLAEMYIQALQVQHPERTKFMAVRFGNVLGSSGSVIPLFRSQIAAGGPVTVTHPDMTRYFMTIPEACILVLQSALQGQGGEIFVLDMGKPVRIVDLARQVIELSGLTPDVDIQIKFIGMRPGEKLFEELSHRAENVVATRHPKILRLVASPPDLEGLRLTFEQFRADVRRLDALELKRRLKSAVPEYVPFLPSEEREVIPSAGQSASRNQAKSPPVASA